MAPKGHLARRAATGKEPGAEGGGEGLLHGGEAFRLGRGAQGASFKALWGATELASTLT